MSETTTDVAAAAAAAAVQADADAAAAAQATQQEAAAEPAPGAEEAAAAEAAAAEAAKKPTRQERHVANLTRKAADEARAREAAERRAEAAEALLAAAKGETGDTTPAPRAAAEPDREAIRAEIRFNDRLSEIDVAGKKDMGADAWETAKATLTGLGAVKNVAFLQALAETEHPAKIFAAMADDTDALLDLLAKPPAAMAAKLGRLDASFAKPAPKPLSGAPKPAAKVEGGSNPPPVSMHDPKLSDAEFTREAQRLMPHLFGGKRRVA